MTKISLRSLAVYRASNDRANALFFDPLMVKVGFIFGPIFAAWPLFTGSATWALVVFAGTLVMSCSVTTRVRIDANSVTVSRRQFIFREGAPQTFTGSGSFEADHTTAFEDDSTDPNAFAFRKAGSIGAEISNDWRAVDRASAIAWLNGQLERLGLLDRSYPARRDEGLPDDR